MTPSSRSLSPLPPRSSSAWLEAQDGTNDDPFSTTRVDDQPRCPLPRSTATSQATNPRRVCCRHRLPSQVRDTILRGEACQKQPAPVRCRARTYTAEVKDALVIVWRASNRLCSKRLVAFLPEFLPVLERHKHLSLSDETRTILLGISATTVDRLLKNLRRHGRRRSFGGTRPGSLLKHQIPVRTFADWDDLVPGFVEADLVAHCGTTTHGAFLNSLVLTDVSTGWTK